MTKKPASGTGPLLSDEAPDDWVRIPFYRTAEEQKRMLEDIAAEQAKNITPRDEEGIQQ